MHYKVPTKKEFKASFGVGSLRRSLPKGAMHRISRLLEMHDQSMLERRDKSRVQLLHDIEMHAHYALRHPKSSGIADKQQRIDSVKALQHAVRGELCRIMKVRHYSEARSIMANRFGMKAVNKHPDDNQIYQFNDDEINASTLHFVNGYVCMMDPDTEGESMVYDTDWEASLGGRQTNLEHGGALFVLTRDLKLQVSGRAYPSLDGDFKHTSFLSGAAVLAAGTLRCENGKLKWISAKSGHYQPTSRHMLTLLEFLRAKQIDLRKVDFYRTVKNAGAVANQGRAREMSLGEFQKCNAMDFLNARGFKGENPQDMFIRL